MSRIIQNVVINWSDADIKDHIKDLTMVEPEPPKENEKTGALIKRRKSIKAKGPEKMNFSEKTNSTAPIAEEEFIPNPFTNVTNHFEFASTGASKTSNNKLDQGHRISYAEMIDVLASYKSKINDQIEGLNQSYYHYFDKWLIQLRFGFNVLLYGVGSKKILLEKFVKNYLQNDYHLVLLGYHPDLNTRNILKNIIYEVLGIADTFKTFDEQINVIRKHLQFPLYLVIHNIDGNCLRDSEIQFCLSELATIPNVHFVASVDHINSALLWDQKQFISFKWIYYDMSTFKSYNDEIMFENSLMLNHTGNVQLSSLIHVLKSLTQNAKNIFLLMVENVLKEENNKKNIAFSKLYYQCREKFYVSNELTLRAQLTEFIDHKMIKLKTEADGYETIYLLIDENNLKLYLEELKDKV